MKIVYFYYYFPDPRWRFDAAIEEEEANARTPTRETTGVDGSTGSMYRRSAQVTNVRRVGRARSRLRVKARTHHDRDSEATGGNAADLQRRLATTSAAAAKKAFDFVAFRDMVLAGAGTVTTFHFAHRSNTLSGKLDADASTSALPSASALLGRPPSPIIGPDLTGLSVMIAPLPPAPPSPAPLVRASSGSASENPSASGVDGFVTYPTVARLPHRDVSEMVLPPTAMTAVQLSWSLVKGRMDAVGKSVLAKLFEKQPDKLQLFGFREDPNYLNGRSLKV